MTRFKTFDEAATKSHPSAEIYHEITWWIERPLTLDEWIKLDDLMYEAFDKMGLEPIGIAGPIPETNLPDPED